MCMWSCGYRYGGRLGDGENVNSGWAWPQKRALLSGAKKIDGGQNEADVTNPATVVLTESDRLFYWPSSSFHAAGRDNDQTIQEVTGFPGTPSDAATATQTTNKQHMIIAPGPGRCAPSRTSAWSR